MKSSLRINMLVLLSIFTYHSSDLAVLDGGTSEPIRNWFGPLGAYISRTFFLAFGVATYPIVLLLLLCTIRSFIPVPVLRRGYFVSILSVIAGLSVLFAVFPVEFVSQTASLGIGHAGEPANALSGGIFGSFLAAPAVNGTIKKSWVRTLMASHLFAKEFSVAPACRGVLSGI